jgi:hypothetical protein
MTTSAVHVFTTGAAHAPSGLSRMVAKPCTAVTDSRVIEVRIHAPSAALEHRRNRLVRDTHLPRSGAGTAAGQGASPGTVPNVACKTDYRASYLRLDPLSAWGWHGQEGKSLVRQNKFYSTKYGSSQPPDAAAVAVLPRIVRNQSTVFDRRIGDGNEEGPP